MSEGVEEEEHWRGHQIILRGHSKTKQKIKWRRGLNQIRKGVHGSPRRPDCGSDDDKEHHIGLILMETFKSHYML